MKAMNQEVPKNPESTNREEAIGKRSRAMEDYHGPERPFSVNSRRPCNSSGDPPFIIADMNDTPGASSDETRFAQWVHTHGKAVRGFLRGMLRQADLADELCQEVFCRAWQARGRYREEGNSRAYLLRIADRLACDRSRQARPVQLDEAGWRANEPVSRGAEPSQAVALGEQTQLLAEALEQLSSVQRRVLLLRYYGQFNFAEIAAMLDCPLNTTLSHGHRGLEALRRLLEAKSP